MIQYYIHKPLCNRRCKRKLNIENTASPKINYIWIRVKIHKQALTGERRRQLNLINTHNILLIISKLIAVFKAYVSSNSHTRQPKRHQKDISPDTTLRIAYNSRNSMHIHIKLKYNIQSISAYLNLHCCNCLQMQRSLIYICISNHKLFSLIFQN